MLKDQKEQMAIALDKERLKQRTELEEFDKLIFEEQQKKKGIEDQITKDKVEITFL